MGENSFQSWVQQNRIKLHIDYLVIKGFNFVTMDMSGDFHAWEQRPTANSQFWQQGGQSEFLRYMRGSANGDKVDWRDCIADLSAIE